MTPERKQYMKEYRAKNKEKINAYNAKNKEKRYKTYLKWVKKNRQRRREIARASYHRRKNAAKPK